MESRNTQSAQIPTNQGEHNLNLFLIEHAFLVIATVTFAATGARGHLLCSLVLEWQQHITVHGCAWVYKVTKA